MSESVVPGTLEHIADFQGTRGLLLAGAPLSAVGSEYPQKPVTDSPEVRGEHAPQKRTVQSLRAP